jgi:dienelactone hydrolase
MARLPHEKAAIYCKWRRIAAWGATLGGLLLCGAGWAQGFDRLREAELAAGLARPPAGWEVLRLDGPAGPYPALYLDARGGRALGGVLLLPDLGAGVAQPPLLDLGRSLAARGWQALVAQLPLPYPAESGAANDLLAEAQGRTESAVAELRRRRVPGIVLAGHGWGARIAVAQAGAGRDPDLAGLILLGGTDVRLPETFGSLPVLDLFGERDVAAAAAAGERMAAARRHPRHRYRQVSLDGADHGFTALGDALARRVAGWLEREVAPRLAGPPAASSGTRAEDRSHR